MLHRGIAIDNDELSLFERFVWGGDKYALELIYQKYYDLLLNYGLKYNNNKELVKDCIQDLFIDLYRNSHIHVEQVVSVRAYLLKALKNNLTYKMKLLSKENSLDEVDFNMPVDEDLFEKMFSKDDEETELAHRVLDAISKLSSNQKTALYLRYVKGFSHREIAEAMNMNIQSSMNLSSRALSKLREWIGDGPDSVALQAFIILFLKSFFK